VAQQSARRKISPLFASSAVKRVTVSTFRLSS